MKFSKAAGAAARILSSNAVILPATVWLLAGLINPLQMAAYRSNHLAVPLNHLLEVTDGNATPDREKMTDYLLFFKSIYNDRAQLGIHGLSGLTGTCYFYLGDLKRAQMYYEKIFQKRPELFWPKYNLAVVYYEQGKYEPALDLAQQALLTDESNPSLFPPPISFMPLIQNVNEYNQSRMQRVETGKKQLCVVIAMSLSRLKRWNELTGFCTLILKQSKNSMTWFYNYQMGLSCLNMKAYDQAFRFLILSLQQQPLKDAYDALQTLPLAAKLSLKAPADALTLGEYFRRFPLRVYFY